MKTEISRRRVLLGSLALGATGWVGGMPSIAAADPLVYDSPAAFDVAEQGHLDIGYEDNEAGGYAWGASYYLLGLLRMYEAYEDTTYLDRFADYAEQVLNTTDASRGVSDYAGRSGPVWRTSGAYTASHGTVRDANGADLLQVRWAGKQPDKATAEISDVVDESFTITLRTPATSNVVTLTDASLDPDSDRYVVDLVNAAYTPWDRWSAKDLRRRPGSTSKPAETLINFESQFYVFAVHTGMVTYPLAKYCRIMTQTPALSRSEGARQARRLLRIVQEAVDFHDHEFQVRPDGTGDYAWPKGAPVPFDGLMQPYNQSHGLGQTMVELYRITKQDRYRDRCRAMLDSFRGGVAEGENGAWTWPYWPVNSELYKGYSADEELSTYTPSYTSATQIEDVSHASITAEFVKEAGEAGIVDWDLTPIATTFTDNVIRSADQVWWRIDGSTDALPANAVQCARWMLYADLDREIYEQSLRVYDAVQLVPSQGSHALGIAYLNWAKVRE